MISLASVMVMADGDGDSDVDNGDADDKVFCDSGDHDD